MNRIATTSFQRVSRRGVGCAGAMEILRPGPEGIASR